MMKYLLILLSAIALLWMNGCSKTGSDAGIDLSKVEPGDKLVLSETVLLEGLPNSVIPYATKPPMQFSNLELTKNGDFIDGNADFVRITQDDFVIIIVLSTEKEMLYGYFDKDTNLSFHLPSGTVLFGIKGDEVTGEDQGSIHFSLSGKVFNGYNFFGESGDAYLFSVPGNVNPQSLLPGDQSDIETFNASSNVLKIQFDLK